MQITCNFPAMADTYFCLLLIYEYYCTNMQLCYDDVFLKN